LDALWAELINSDWSDHLGSGRREDRIGNDGWLATFLGRTSWWGRALPSAAERERLRTLRRLLRRMIDALLAVTPIAESDTAALNRTMAKAPVKRRLAREGEAWTVELTMARGTIDDVLGEVAGSFAAMLARGEGDRVKVCENPDCGWVMVDSSRNRSRRWCDAAECGNVMKVRRYRQRHRRTG
jgi:predicted RNA-binding Zn ribbon-like protein